MGPRQRWNVNFIFNAREDEGIWVIQSSWRFCYSEFQLQQCAVWQFTILLKSVLYSCGRFPFSIPGKHIVSFKHGLWFWTVYVLSPTQQGWELITLISNKRVLCQCILSQACSDIFSQKGHLPRTVPALCCTSSIYQHLGSMPPRRKVCCQQRCEEMGK